MLIECELFQIVITDGLDTQVIVLRERNGDRTLPIFIGSNEARAIKRKLNDDPIPRPLTHDLAVDIITKLGGTIARVLIVDLREETYFARIEIRQDGEIREIDARPSDAIALAVRGIVPIYVEEVVFVRSDKTPDFTKL